MNLTAQINALAVDLRMRGTIPCALLGRTVRSTECCSRGLAATVEEFQRCRACPEGQRLAASAPLWSYSKPLPAPVVAPSAPVPVAERPKRLRGRTTLVMLDDMAFLPASTPAAKPKAPRPARPAKPVAKPLVMGVDHGKPGGDRTVEVKLAVGDKGAVALSFREIKPKAPRQPKPKAPRPERPAKAAAEPVITTAQPAPQPAQPVIDPRLARLASVLRELTADGRMRVSMLDLMRALGAANYDEAAGLVIHAGLRTSQLSGPVQTVLVDHAARQLMASAASEVRQ